MAFCLLVILFIYALHVPIPSHQRSITLIWVQEGVPVSFNLSIAIDKIVTLIIIALISPSQSSFVLQPMITLVSVRLSCIFFIMSKLTNEYIIITFTPSVVFDLSITFFQSLSPSSSSADGIG